MTAPDTILVFGTVGTQIHVGARVYEMVELTESGAALWRSRCVSCREVIFVRTRDGKVPVVNRCSAHMRRAHHPELPAEEPAHPRFTPDRIQPESFMPLPEEFAGGPITLGMSVVGQARGSIANSQAANAFPLFGSIKMHMGDADQTTVETQIGDERAMASLREEDRERLRKAAADALENVVLAAQPGGLGVTNALAEGTGLASGPYSLADMSAELEELAPEGEEEDALPTPLSLQELWEPRLDMWRRDKIWGQSWGPRPDQPGCEVPDGILDQTRGRRR